MKIDNVGLVLTGLLVLSLANVAIAGDWQKIKETGVLRVAVYKDFPPYSYLADGAMQGVDVDIARTLAERLGVGISTMNLTASDEAMGDDLRNAVWKGHYLGGGTADVMMHVPVDEAFAKANDRVKIFGAYFQEEIAIAHNKERIPRLDNLLIFTREKVAVELETVADMYLSSAENRRLLNRIVHFRSVGEACDALKTEAVAAFMGPRAQLEDCIGDNPDEFAIVPTPARRVKMFTWAVGMAVKADSAELSHALNQALQQLRADGVLQTIFTQHGISYQAPSAPIAVRDSPKGD